jgi:putative acyl-CoA dehydrogenase
VRARVEETFAGRDGDSAEQRLHESQFGARRLVEDLAIALQASLLVRHAPPAVADGFCAGRLDGDRGRVYGTLPAGVDAKAIIDRAVPG